ncbi:hypothetical protein B0I35DRAFT_450697 [Stachybotrys elegans]|uniref:Galactose oxidase n=1 Tax=Stachybotrys elegans TaxID=80388 RepID=A0A8K0T032_9HYPO|nr:hypothetical protein B0I35DRAFT_450697 [Stachybotrys elegans]
MRCSSFEPLSNILHMPCSRPEYFPTTLLSPCSSEWTARYHITAPPRGAWQSLASIPIAPRQEHTTVAISNTTMAIFGGIMPQGDGLRTTGILQLYDISKDKWSLGSPAPVQANHPNLASVDGMVYLLGGMSETTDSAWEGFPESMVYDAGADRWSRLKPMPAKERRGSAAIGVYKDTIFLAGGLRRLEPFAGGVQTTMDVVSAFNTVSGRWIPLPKAARRLPEPRDHAGGAVVGHHFYVLGGRMNGQVNVKDTVFVLDLDNMEKGWRVSPGRLPTPRGGLSAATMGPIVYTFGGEGNPAAGSGGVFNETEAFDTRTETWTQLQPMAMPRHGTSAVAVGSKFFIPGGGKTQGGDPVDVMDAYSPWGMA